MLFGGVSAKTPSPRQTMLLGLPHLETVPSGWHSGITPSGTFPQMHAMLKNQNRVVFFKPRKGNITHFRVFLGTEWCVSTYGPPSVWKRNRQPKQPTGGATGGVVPPPPPKKKKKTLAFRLWKAGVHQHHLVTVELITHFGVGLTRPKERDRFWGRQDHVFLFLLIFGFTGKYMVPLKTRPNILSESRAPCPQSGALRKEPIC